LFWFILNETARFFAVFKLEIR
jgi:hypothetical protein